MARSVREKAEIAFETYYAMRTRNLQDLAVAVGESFATVLKWSKAYDWKNRIMIRDGETRDAQISRMIKMTDRQMEVLDRKLDDAHSGIITDVGDIVKISNAVNATRDSIYKAAAYEDERSARISTNSNTEVLDKLSSLKKDMKELGLSGVQFDSASSILDGE